MHEKIKIIFLNFLDIRVT